MKTNLTTSPLVNGYHRVTASFDVYIRVGYSESNTYFGSAMALGVVHRALTLQPGDEVHALCGGLFVLTAAGIFDAKLEVSGRHPFEKNHSGIEAIERWPLDKLSAISEREARKPAAYRGADLPRMPAGRIVGMGIDSILDETARPSRRNRSNP